MQRILCSLLLLFSLWLLGLASPAWADAGASTSLCYYVNGVCQPVTGSTPLPTRGSAATTLTPVAPMQTNVSVASATSLTVPAGATLVEAICSAAVNWRDDGTAPTSSAGMSLLGNTLFSYAGSLSAIQFIAQSSATCSFSYYK